LGHSEGENAKIRRRGGGQVALSQTKFCRYISDFFYGILKDYQHKTLAVVGGNLPCPFNLLMISTIDRAAPNATLNGSARRSFKKYRSGDFVLQEPDVIIVEEEFFLLGFEKLCHILWTPRLRIFRHLNLAELVGGLGDMGYRRNWKSAPPLLIERPPYF